MFFETQCICYLFSTKYKLKYRKTRWLYHVECPQYSIQFEALGCRLTQAFHKTKEHDEMTEIFQCYKLP